MWAVIFTASSARESSSVRKIFSPKGERNRQSFSRSASGQGARGSREMKLVPMGAMLMEPMRSTTLGRILAASVPSPSSSRNQSAAGVGAKV